MRMYEEHEKCELQTETHLYKIGMFAQMNHVTVKTLRFYEEQGLLIPAYVDEENGYRYYGDEEARLFQKIIVLRKLGVSVPEIKNLIEDTGHMVMEGVEHNGYYVYILYILYI